MYLCFNSIVQKWRVSRICCFKSTGIIISNTLNISYILFHAVSLRYHSSSSIKLRWLQNRQVISVCFLILGQVTNYEKKNNRRNKLYFSCNYYFIALITRHDGNERSIVIRYVCLVRITYDEGKLKLSSITERK